MKKFEKFIIIALVLFGVFAVGLNIGYKMAIHDAVLMDVTPNGYTIGYGDEAHGYNVHDYIGTVESH